MPMGARTVAEEESLGQVSVSRPASECSLEGDLKARVCPEKPGTEQLACSGGDLSLEVGAASSEVAQSVACVLVFTLAFQSCADSKRAFTASSLDRSKKFSTEKVNSKARRYYHVEYFLLPDDEEPKKVDMVVFPNLTKVFTESGVKTVKPWLEGDKIWVTWTQNFNMQVTKELLKKINFHKIIMKIWDSKDKVSRKVRYYRLKASGYTEDLSAYEVRNLVVHQRRLSEQNDYSKEDWNTDFITAKTGKARRAKGAHEPDNVSMMIPEDFERLAGVEGSNSDLQEHSGGLHAPFPKEGGETSKYKRWRALGLHMAGPGLIFNIPYGRLNPTRWSLRRTLPSLGGTLAPELRELLEKSSFDSITNTAEKPKPAVRHGDSLKRKPSKRPKKLSKEEESEFKLVTTSFAPDFLVIQLPLTPLLAGWKMVMSRGSGRSPNILDCFLTLKTDEPIMSEQHRQELNPMTIKIDRLTCLPTTPVPLWELERLCVPVYCRYQLPGLPAHVTEGHPHDTRINFQDVNVILLGDMHPGDLREFLDGPPLVVEIHDRDRKAENTTQRPALFGEDPLDLYPNLHAFVSPRDTESSPFESQKTWDPYGVARVSFADLLLGHKGLNLAVPVHSCELQPTKPSLDKRRTQVLDGAQPLPMGNYLDAHTQFKMQVDIAVPLTPVGPKTPAPDPTAPPFGRMVFVFRSRQHCLLRPLLRDITVINARALSPDPSPLGKVKQILPAIKVRMNISDRPDLDVITGLHLLDGQLHLLILEGLASRALKRLWENYQSRIPFVEARPCAPYKVLYNSQLLFRRRLYGDLESAVHHLRLFQPLAQLMRRSELYLRDTVPKPVFQALTRIYDICCQNTRLKEVVTGDLLPSAAMVRALSQQFGVPISREEYLEGGGLAALSPPRSAPPEQGVNSRVSLSQDIEEHQERYLRWRDSAVRQSQQPGRNFIQNNILNAYRAGKKPVKCVRKAMRISAPAGDAVFNYSTQTLNSSELARKELQREMAREPGKRFTYSQQYLSAMVDCHDPEEERTVERASRQAWLTTEGFRVMGTQTSYLFPLQLGTAFTEEWQEGALFRNVLENVLDRDRWPWERRHQDFELYRKPPPFLPLPLVPKRTSVPGTKLKGSS